MEGFWRVRGGCQIMRTPGVGVHAPPLDDDLSFLQRVGDLAVQTLVPQLAVERFAVAVFPGLPGNTREYSLGHWFPLGLRSGKRGNYQSYEIDERHRRCCPSDAAKRRDQPTSEEWAGRSENS